MKRFFLGIIGIISILASLEAFAADSLVQKVYKIESYKTDTLNDSFEFLGHGSAVLIGKNKIITNAHVVLGEDDLPTGNYNLCVSDNFENPPKCQTSLKLLGYDKTNDLALLETIENIPLGTPVKLSPRKLELGEMARVYGYPANGGETITLTEGKVSGLDNGKYKIDANIDAGNSGGGAFDKDGKFIGIPYIASVGYSTLGYIIPISMIQDFIAGKGDITSYGKTNTQFIQYIGKINASLLSQKIDNPSIEFDGFQKKGFTLKGIDEKSGSAIGNYFLSSKTSNTTISLSVSEIYGQKNLSLPVDIEKLKEVYTKVVEKKNFSLGGKKIIRMIAIVGEKKADGTTNKNLVSLNFYLENGINFQIETEDYGSEKKIVNNAISLFIKNLQIKKDTQTIERSSYKETPLSFDVVSSMNMSRSFDTLEFFFDSSILQQGSISTKKGYDGEGKNALANNALEEVGKIALESYNSYKLDNTMQLEVKKNSLGTYYISSTITSKEEGLFLYSTFYTKIDSLIYTTTISYKTNKKDVELEKKYYQLLDTVKLSGQFPFKSATIGKITSVSNGSGSTTSSGTITQ